jgi:hypothetical protein
VSAEAPAPARSWSGSRTAPLLRAIEEGDRASAACNKTLTRRGSARAGASILAALDPYLQRCDGGTGPEICSGGP